MIWKVLSRRSKIFAAENPKKFRAVSRLSKEKKMKKMTMCEASHIDTFS